DGTLDPLAFGAATRAQEARRKVADLELDWSRLQQDLRVEPDPDQDSDLWTTVQEFRRGLDVNRGAFEHAVSAAIHQTLLLLTPWTPHVRNSCDACSPNAGRCTTTADAGSSTSTARSTSSSPHAPARRGSTSS